MKKNLVAILIVLVLINNGCTPEPVSINIAELPPQLCVSTVTPNADTLIAIVSYSINSLIDINNFNNGVGTPTLPPGLLVDNAEISISDGNTVQVLTQHLSGIYSNTTINLQNGVSYTLKVRDPAKNNSVEATTHYIKATPSSILMPVVTRHLHDTTIVLNMTIPDNSVTPNYYLMAYDHINPKSVPSIAGSSKFSVVSLNAIKKIEVFTNADAVNNVITKSFIINDISPTDTLFVHYAQIDKGYYNYLAAYKRTGSLISQIAAEPITLPTNIITGLGYFALYDAQRTFYKLVDY